MPAAVLLCSGCGCCHCRQRRSTQARKPEPDAQRLSRPLPTAPATRGPGAALPRNRSNAARSLAPSRHKGSATARVTTGVNAPNRHSARSCCCCLGARRAYRQQDALARSSVEMRSAMAGLSVATAVREGKWFHPTSTSKCDHIRRTCIDIHRIGLSGRLTLDERRHFQPLQALYGAHTGRGTLSSRFFCSACPTSRSTRVGRGAKWLRSSVCHEVHSEAGRRAALGQ
jgi:hypothetical protein